MPKKGGIPWNKGKVGVYSEKTLELMKEKKRGKRQSEKTRQKNSESHKGKEVEKIKNGEVGK